MNKRLEEMKLQKCDTTATTGGHCPGEVKYFIKISSTQATVYDCQLCTECYAQFLMRQLDHTKAILWMEEK